MLQTLAVVVQGAWRDEQVKDKSMRMRATSWGFECWVWGSKSSLVEGHSLTKTTLDSLINIRNRDPFRRARNSSFRHSYRFMGKNQ